MKIPQATLMSYRVQGWPTALAHRTSAVASNLSASLSGTMLIALAGLAAYAPRDPGIKIIAALPPQSTTIPLAERHVKAIDLAPDPSTSMPGQRRSRESTTPLQTAFVLPAAMPKAPEPAPLPLQTSNTIIEITSATPPDAWSSAEVTAAVQDCVSQLAPLSATAQVLPPVKLGQCGAPAPVLLSSVGLSKVALQPPAITTCRMVVALNQWIDSTIQPAAKEVFGSSVTRIIGASSYACRNRNNQASGPMSEHAFANAIDILGFVLENGRKITVVDGWGATARDQKTGNRFGAAKYGSANGPPTPTATRPGIGSQPTSPSAAQQLAGPATPFPPVSTEATAPASTTSTKSPAATDEARFLFRLHQGACGIFGTVLGPEANEFHRDHFHVDLKVRKSRAFCE